MIPTLMMSISLPDTIWNVILSYVGNTKDFRSCEKTCRLLRRILSNEAVWNIWESQWAFPSFPVAEEVDTPKYSYKYLGESPWIPPPLPAAGSKTSLRENCLAWQAFVSSRLSVRSTESIVLSVLGVHRWKQLVKYVMAHASSDVPFQASHGFYERSLNETNNVTSPVVLTTVVYPGLGPGLMATGGGEWGWGDMRVPNIFTLRGDASSALLNVVESCIITQLLRALYIANAQERLLVTATDFHVQGCLFPTDGYLNTFASGKEDPFIYVNGYRTGFRGPCESVGISGDEMNTISCRFAARADIVSMDRQLYTEIVKTLFDLIVVIMSRVCIELSDRGDKMSPDTKTPLRSHESISDVAPYPKILGTWTCCKEPVREHVVVPKQIEAAAEFYRITRRVVNIGWHVNSVTATGEEYERAVVAEREIAQRDYVCIADPGDASGTMGSVSSEKPGSDYSMDSEESDEELSSSFTDIERFWCERQCCHSERPYDGTADENLYNPAVRSFPTVLIGDQTGGRPKGEATEVRFWSPWLNEDVRSERCSGAKII